MEELLVNSIIISQVTAFLIMLLFKFEVISYVQANSNGIINKLFNCIFCLSFWIGLIITVIIYLLSGCFFWFAPILSASLNRLQF